ncbi:50S ribosomal protein L35 [Candidatus Nasuia deltocephalinicola]|nr:50S ribosomal protein L35 [Candidatus Nasuia deltocephalinicola]
MYKRNKSFYKRFYFTFGGIKRSRAFKRHILFKKSSNLKRFLKKKIFIKNFLYKKFIY